MFYETYGEFEVPCKAGKKEKTLDFSKEVLAKFWNEIEERDEKHSGLSKACGCYIFAIRAGKGMVKT